MDKTRAAIRDLHTQITVSLHSVESISRRIETLRDEELHPQLLELMLGYVRKSLIIFPLKKFNKLINFHYVIVKPYHCFLEYLALGPSDLHIICLILST